VGAWYGLAIGVLVTWRVTHLLHAEDGPWLMFAKLRASASRVELLRQLLDCFYCLSIWIAAPLAYLLGHGWLHRLLLVPALSAGAIVIERLTGSDAPAFVEDAVAPPPE
jgi:hypothetical protein